MRYSLASLALAAVAYAAPQGVTSAIAPAASAPAGCATSHSGTFQIQIVNVTTSAKVKRQAQDEAAAQALTISLSNGVLTDAKGRTGYIASNRQFQFDGPVQAGAIYTSGFSLCGNGSLALGGSAIWYACLSGGYYNLYDQSIGGQCSQIYIDALMGGSAGVTQSSDGQPAASTAGAVTQISDAQPQAPTSTSAKPVTQISDGQIQATSATAKPVTQISDGQIQATSAATAKPVTQISDGQPQAPKSTPVTQISDGQIQAPPMATGGATPARNGTGVASATPSVQPYTGGAAVSGVAGSLFVIVAGVLAFGTML